ncbi:hypothetical protein [Methanobacterium sp.]|uniref:hypothetical protein n=1 Tax=Methanobacterium sp. TaxID=2164 RepID=UPI003C75EE61
MTGGGGAIENEGNLKVINNTFEYNCAKYGGAILIREGNTSVANNIFKLNSADYGGAIENYGNQTYGKLDISNNKYSVQLQN